MEIRSNEVASRPVQAGVIVGLFSVRGNAENAVAELMQAGFGSNQLGYEGRDPKAGEATDYTTPDPDHARTPNRRRAARLGTPFEAPGLRTGTGLFSDATRASSGSGADDSEFFTSPLTSRLSAETRTYLRSSIQSGAVALIVDAGSRVTEVRSVLERHGAVVRS